VLRNLGNNIYVIILLTIIVVMSDAALLCAQPDPLAIMRGMAPEYEKVDNYTAVFLKQELVEGELLPQETIRFKFKKPFKVYMGWMKGPHEGREALYVRGENDGKVIGHEGGLFGFITLHMEPTGSTAMKGNRHPITDVGIGRLIDIITSNGERALKEGALVLDYIGAEKVYGRDTRHIRAKLPPGKGYYGARIDIWVDLMNGLPIKIEVYGWDGALWESYGYRDLKLNPGLTDAEFREDYPGYSF
jgi:Protein of unknown function (DUF1571)